MIHMIYIYIVLYNDIYIYTYVCVVSFLLFKIHGLQQYPQYPLLRYKPPVGDETSGADPLRWRVEPISQACGPVTLLGSHRFQQWANSDNSDPGCILLLIAQIWIGFSWIIEYHHWILMNIELMNIMLILWSYCSNLTYTPSNGRILPRFEAISAGLGHHLVQHFGPHPWGNVKHLTTPHN